MAFSQRGYDPKGQLVFPDLDTPEVLLELNALERNLQSMAQIARAAKINLRPHVKTHKSPELAKRQVAAGAVGITVAKLAEAELMAAHGLDDILVAYPLVGRHKLERLANLHQKAKLTVSTDSFECSQGLNRVAQETGKPLNVYIEVDTGLGRCGHQPGQETVAVVERMRPLKNIRVVGVMAHEGHAWSVLDPAGREAIIRATSKALADTAHRLKAAGFPCTEVSVGATPTSFHAHAAKGATEMRPGTYIFNDVNVVTHGLAELRDCAVTVLATVVGRPAATRVILDVGSKTLSQDGAVGNDLNGFILAKPSWRLVGLTEEHGVVNVPESEAVNIGERVRIVPNHVCVVTNLVDRFVTVRGSEVVGTLEVAARGLTK